MLIFYDFVNYYPGYAPWLMTCHPLLFTSNSKHHTGTVKYNV